MQQVSGYERLISLKLSAQVSRYKYIDHLH
jgi:hypothetical protein